MVPNNKRYGGTYGYGYGYAPVVQSSAPAGGRRKGVRSTPKERETKRASPPPQA
jgi:hypothetical protein